MPDRGLTLLAAVACALGAAHPAAAQIAAPLPDLPDTEITLSWQEFKRLVEAAGPQPTPAPAPPVEAFLRSAEYTGVLGEGLLTLDAVVRLEVLADGWVTLPLWQQGAVVSFAAPGVSLIRHEQGVAAVVRGPSSVVVRARLAVAAPDRPGENRLALALPAAGRTLLDLTAAAGIDDLSFESGLTVRQSDRRVFAALDSTQAVVRYSLPYRTGEVAAGEEVTREPRVLVDAAQFLTLGDGVIGGLLVLDYQVRVAEVGAFEVGLDDAIEIFDVTAEGLESWRVLQRDGARVLRVRMASPVEGVQRVVVTFDGSYETETGRLTVPRFEPLGVEREAGFVAVAADGAEVSLELSGNLLPADVAEIPADVRAYGGNLVAALKYSGEPAAARVTVVEHEDAAVLTAIVEHLNASTVVLANGTEATWLDLGLRNNRKQFLKLRLPADGVEVWSLLVDGEPSRPKRSEDQVLVPLPTDAAERSTRVSLVLLRTAAEAPWLGTLAPALPGLDVPVSEALWTVYLPPERRYRVVDDRFRVVRITSPLRGRARRGGGGVSGLADISSVGSYAPMSGRIQDLQDEQTEKLQQQVVARQGSSRRGALPVRIELPGGVTAMPQAAVTRVLMVDTEPVALKVRVYPGWLNGALRWLQLGLILTGGALAGLVAAGRLDRGRAWRPVLGVVLASLVPLGAFGPFGASVLVAFVAGCVFLVAAVGGRIRARRSRKPLTPDET